MIMDRQQLLLLGQVSGSPSFELNREGFQFPVSALAQHLAGRDVARALPPMLVTIKTPLLPLQMAGQALRADLTWQVTTTARGMTALGYDDKQRLCAFVVSEEQTQQAFSLLRELHSAQVS